MFNLHERDLLCNFYVIFNYSLLILKTYLKRSVIIVFFSLSKYMNEKVYLLSITNYNKKNVLNFKNNNIILNLDHKKNRNTVLINKVQCLK